MTIYTGTVPMFVMFLSKLGQRNNVPEQKIDNVIWWSWHARMAIVWFWVATILGTIHSANVPPLNFRVRLS